MINSRINNEVECKWLQTQTKILQYNMSKKNKYNRRRAVDCTIIEKSKSYPGYFKYLITVAEINGTTSKHPVYGKDMQNALARLMNQERTRWFERKLTSGWALILWILILGGPVIVSGVESPWPLVYAYAAIGTVAGSGYWWNKYITRGK